jgi:predicted ATPase
MSWRLGGNILQRRKPLLGVFENFRLSWELRAAMTMAQLWRDQGKRDEARDLLAPVCGWFTKGFNTLDLKEAKGLLDELAA